MCKVNYFGCTFHCDVESCTISGDAFVDSNALAVKFPLESINMLVVWLEVKQSDSVVLATFDKTLDDSLGDV